MKSRLLFLSLIFLFWTGFFLVCRILFLLFHIDQSASLSAYEWFMINGLGLRMDLSMAGYLTLLPAVGMIFSFAVSDKIMVKIIHFINLVYLISCSVIVVADLELYLHWGFRMDATPLLYLQPEALASSTTSRLLFLTIIWILLTGISAFLYKKFVIGFLIQHPIKVTQLLPIGLFAAFLFLPIRSGIGVAPLNTGFVYFHTTKSFPNHAGINVVWNFFRSVIYRDALRYPTDLADRDSSEKRIQKLMSKPDSTTLVLNTSKPNVLVIILESYTSKVIGALGGRPEIAPNLSSLIQEGLIFDQVYASGDRTDKGIISILSGYPAQPRTSIVKFPSKSQTLPNWPAKMADLGYRTSFTYGGDPKFANIESYLYISRFQSITQEKNFPREEKRNKWGVHDEGLYRQLLQELDTASAPFFKVALTLSSHEPFDVPSKKLSQGSSPEELFLNSCRYTDSVTGAFLKSAQQKSWWKNTLVVITADHGHAYPGKREEMNKERFLIPLVWMGGALRDEYKGQRISVTGSQTDLANTLLHQLQAYDDQFRFSRDLLAPNPTSFAVFTFNNGYGVVTPHSDFIWDFEFKRHLIYNGPVHPEAEETGRAFMQVLFNDYNER